MELTGSRRLNLERVKRPLSPSPSSSPSTPLFARPRRSSSALPVSWRLRSRVSCSPLEVSPHLTLRFNSQVHWSGEMELGFVHDQGTDGICTDYMNASCHACIGGTSVGEDIRKLDHGQHVVSGTPGRVFDMIKRRHLRTRNIKMLVLDEADELLSQGFAPQVSPIHPSPRSSTDREPLLKIYDIYRFLPPSTQVVVLSATLPHDVLEMTTKFMTDPVRILVKRDELTLEGIKQFFVAVEKEEYKVSSCSTPIVSTRADEAGSAPRCSTCTTVSLLPKLSSSATREGRSTGSRRR